MLTTGMLSAQRLNIASYNLRYDNEADRTAGNAWKDRLPQITGILTKADPDVFGTQEGLFNQLSDLLHAMPAYEYSGLGREGGRDGEHSAIWYKRDKFAVMESGNFWLSQTPEKRSKGWDAKYERLCSWVKLRERASGYTFFVFNTHFDHKGKVARKESINMIFEQIEAIAGNAPVVLTGDFNMDPSDEAYAEFAKHPRFSNAYDIAADVQTPNMSTVNAFTAIKPTRERIDHVFLSADFSALTWRIGLDTYDGGKFPSDHFPVFVATAAGTGTAQSVPAARPAVAGAGLYPTFPEDFENGAEKLKYDRAGVKLKTGDWILDKVVLQNTVNDAPSSGAFAARFVGDNTSPAILQMDFDLPDGASQVKVAYSSYRAKADAPCMWVLEYSTDKGRSWQQAGDEVLAANKAAKETAIFNLNIKGSVRFRVSKFGLGSQKTDPSISNGRLSIDDFAVYHN